MYIFIYHRKYLTNIKIKNKDIEAILYRKVREIKKPKIIRLKAPPLPPSPTKSK